MEDKKTCIMTKYKFLYIQSAREMNPVSFSVQKDDLDGEIDLKSCVKVSEFDVEKNYGFQIQVSISVTRLFLS